MRLLPALGALLGALLAGAQFVPPYTEECRSGMYPPKGPTYKGQVPWYKIDLDLPPAQRWTKLITEKKAELVSLVDLIKQLAGDFFPSGKLVEIIDVALGPLASTFPAPFADELKGISEVSGVPLGEVVLYNVFYEVFTVCTSLVAMDTKGKMYHARNLDFGLFMGWDSRNNSWMVPARLAPLVVNLDFQRSGKTVFRSTNFAGYVGMLTGMRPAAFTLTMNERFNIDGGYIGIIEWILGQRDGHWMSFLTRSVLENATSYDEALKMLTDTPMLAPAYFILGGAASGEGCVITRARKTTLDVWKMDPAHGLWYVLETNYDHWRPPFFLDDRRTPAMLCMNRTTQTNVTLETIYDVLSTKPVLNKLTTYTALMEIGTGTYEAYLRSCPDPCMPW
ncbi:acid ceramidase [Petromyzon marinus]|uniref:acid ceramidase n=1 Tax=Petromyzon marinus TaxID=7757 RepID=UPI003F6E9D9E